MNRPRIDFAEVKQRVSLEQVVGILDIKWKQKGNQFRAGCPQCRKGDDRVLVVTLGKGFACWSGGGSAPVASGDQIGLYAHVTGCSNYDAAQALAERFIRDRSPTPAPQKAAPEALEQGIAPLDYLEADHEALDLLGLASSVCEAVGIGFARKGTMAGRVCVPIRLPNGVLIGYVGIATRADQSPLLKFPDNLAEMCSQKPEVKSQDELRALLRVV